MSNLLESHACYIYVSDLLGSYAQNSFRVNIEKIGQSTEIIALET